MRPDTDFMLRMGDEARNGDRRLLTTACLKASRRELDEERTTEGAPSPRRARCRSSRGIEKYVLRVRPFTAAFPPGTSGAWQQGSSRGDVTDGRGRFRPPHAARVSDEFGRRIESALA